MADIQDFWRHTYVGDTEVPQDKDISVVWSGTDVLYAKQRENLIGSISGAGTQTTLVNVATGTARYSSTGDFCTTPLTQNINVGDNITISFDVTDVSSSGEILVQAYPLSARNFTINGIGHKSFNFRCESARGVGQNFALKIKNIGAASYVIIKNIKLEKNIVDTQYSVAPSVVDNRVKIGKHYYHTTQIGNLIWTAENLNEDLGGGTWEGYYDNDPTYGVKGYGKLYTWDSICKANETPSDALAAILPAGWRVPTKADFDALATTVGSANFAKVKEKWYWGTAGTNDTGFSAIGSGYKTNGTAFGDTSSRIWSSSINEYTTTNKDYLYIFENTWSINNGRFTGYPAYAYSVRLVRDAATPAALMDDGEV